MADLSSHGLSRRRFLAAGGAAAAGLAALQLPRNLAQAAPAPIPRELAAGTPLPTIRAGFATGPVSNGRIEIRPTAPAGYPAPEPVTVRLAASATTTAQGRPVPPSFYKPGDRLLAFGAVDGDTGEFVATSISTTQPKLVPFTLDWPDRGG